MDKNFKEYMIRVWVFLIGVICGQVVSILALLYSRL